MIQDLLNLFVLQGCHSCGQALTPGESHVCLGCLQQIPQTHFHQRPQDNELYFRLAGRVPLQGAASLFYFDKGGRMQELIQQMKYRSAPKLGRYLGQYYGEHLMDSGFVSGINCLIPVPLHRRRQRKRGYNQAEQIALGLGEKLSLPVNTDLLTRTRNTASQTRKSGRERWNNVLGAFEAEKDLPQHVLLVDDVITMGATLEACMLALLASPNPPKEISVASLAFTRRD